VHEHLPENQLTQRHKETKKSLESLGGLVAWCAIFIRRGDRQGMGLFPEGHMPSAPQRMKMSPKSLDPTVDCGLRTADYFHISCFENTQYGLAKPARNSRFQIELSIDTLYHRFAKDSKGH
jgi:hypothetical protein